MDYLKNIYENDIDLLIKDIDLIINGYELNYIIDPSDVIKYSFPYGLDFNMDRSIDDIGDEMIAYMYLFNHYNPVVLDEYKLELLLNRNNIKDNLDKRFKSDLIKKFVIEYEKSSDNDKDLLLDELSKSSTFLLSTSLMTKSYVDTFDDIYLNKLQVDNLTLKSNDKYDVKLITNIFDNNKRSSWSRDAFDEWVNNNKFASNNNDKLLREFKSTYRDFVVIDRICNINESIQKNVQLNKKYVFLYFSGAKKSETFFKQDTIIKHLPNINGLCNFNLLRSPKHTYLLFIISYFW